MFPELILSTSVATHSKRIAGCCLTYVPHDTTYQLRRETRTQDIKRENLAARERYQVNDEGKLTANTVSKISLEITIVVLAGTRRTNDKWYDELNAILIALLFIRMVQWSMGTIRESSFNPQMFKRTAFAFKASHCKSSSTIKRLK